MQQERETWTCSRMVRRFIYVIFVLPYCITARPRGSPATIKTFFFSVCKAGNKWKASLRTDPEKRNLLSFFLKCRRLKVGPERLNGLVFSE